MKSTSQVCKAFGFVGASLFAALTFTSCLDLSGNSPPDIRVAKEVTSPDSKNVASFYIISGGDAAGYVIMRLKVRTKGQAFKENEDYIFEMRHEYDLDLKWKDNRHLIVTYPASADIHRKSSAKGDIKISYIAKS